MALSRLHLLFQGAAVGGIFGLLTGGYAAFAHRNFLILPVSMVGSCMLCLSFADLALPPLVYFLSVAAPRFHMRYQPMRAV